MIAACIYIACRMQGYPRTLDEISKNADCDMGTVNKMQKSIVQKLQLQIGRLRPIHLVNRIATRMKCAYQICVYAEEICKILAQRELLENLPPQQVAASVIFIVSLLLYDGNQYNHHIDVNKLCEASLVTLSSIKMTYNKIVRGGAGIRSLLPAALKAEVEERSTTSHSDSSFEAILPKDFDKAIKLIASAAAIAAAAPTSIDVASSSNNSNKDTLNKNSEVSTESRTEEAQQSTCDVDQIRSSSSNPTIDTSNSSNSVSPPSTTSLSSVKLSTSAVPAPSPPILEAIEERIATESIGAECITNDYKKRPRSASNCSNVSNDSFNNVDTKQRKTVSDATAVL